MALEKLGIGFVSQHGGVPSRNRGAPMEKFRRDAECRVFLSTDAGGMGLNLQATSAVVNFEPPWNPARLEQRIGRVHRMGQAHPVHVVHLLTKGSIEERVCAEVSFAALGRKSVLQAVKEIFADQPGRPKPLIDQPPPKGVSVESVAASAPAASAGAIPTVPAAIPVAQQPPSSPPAPSPSGFEQAAAGLIETGVRFLESLAAVARSVPARDGSPGLASLVSRDPRTNAAVLSIPLPQSVDQDRVLRAIAALMAAFGRSA